jgi:hypothetical protein
MLKYYGENAPLLCSAAFIFSARWLSSGVSGSASSTSFNEHFQMWPLFDQTEIIFS